MQCIQEGKETKNKIVNYFLKVKDKEDGIKNKKDNSKKNKDDKNKNDENLNSNNNNQEDNEIDVNENNNNVQNPNNPNNENQNNNEQNNIIQSNEVINEIDSSIKEKSSDFIAEGKISNFSSEFRLINHNWLKL